MAVLTCQFLSDTLKRIVPFTAVLPVDQNFEDNYQPGRPMQTLYLLHGLYGDHSDWLVRARVEELAMQNNLAIIMPAGENSFYIDWQQPLGHDYGRFIGEELPAFTRRLFRLSDRREDTFIGGLSMGGYGALRNGLLYNETFSRIIALSSAAHIFEEEPGQSNNDIAWALSVFGDRKAAAETNCNPRVIVRDLLARKAADPATPIPEIFLACGDKDSLAPANRSLHDYLVESGLKVDYHEGHYDHEWDYWNLMLEQAVREWLPVTPVENLVDSGHVHREENRILEI